MTYMENDSKRKGSTFQYYPLCIDLMTIKSGSYRELSALRKNLSKNMDHYITKVIVALKCKILTL